MESDAKAARVVDAFNRVVKKEERRDMARDVGCSGCIAEAFECCFSFQVTHQHWLPAQVVSETIEDLVSFRTMTLQREICRSLCLNNELRPIVPVKESIPIKSDAKNMRRWTCFEPLKQVQLQKKGKTNSNFHSLQEISNHEKQASN